MEKRKVFKRVSVKAAQMRSVARDVEKACTDFTVALSAIAESVRQEIIIPFCDRHQLQFLSGNNDYFFVKQEVTVEHKEGNITFPTRDVIINSSCDVGNDKASIYYRRFGFKRIFQILDHEIAHGVHLGFYLRDVSPIPLDDGE